MKTLEQNLIRASELARLADLKWSTLKFYIVQGLIECEEKTKGGFQLFDEKKAMGILDRIKKLKNKRRTIAEIKETLKSS